MKQTKPKSDVSVEVDGNEAQKFAQRKVDFKKFLKQRAIKMKAMKQRDILPMSIQPEEFDFVDEEVEDFLDDEQSKP